MARKKRKQTRISFKRGFFGRKKKLNFDWLGPGLWKISKIIVPVCFFAVLGFLLYRLDKNYIRPVTSHQTGLLVLKDVPAWASQELKDKIVASAGGSVFQLNENAARIVAENLKSVAWLDNISVQTTSDSIQVFAGYRMPVAIIKSGQTPFYVDANQVVLDYVPLPKLLLVEIKGVSLDVEIPRYGHIWKSGDLAAALEILGKINQMDRDRIIKGGKPLVSEISSIDVSNYRGRKSSGRPHIILYSRDNTPIHWGAEVGAWQKYLESPDEQKLAKLYTYYDQEGTLNANSKVKYIDLCNPKDTIPLPY